MTQAPVVDEPLVAELPIVAVKLVKAEMLLAALVLFTCGQTPTVGVALVTTGTMMVQLVGVAVPAATVRLVTVMVLVAKVTVPPVQVPEAVPEVVRPAGKVSVKL